MKKYTCPICGQAVRLEWCASSPTCSHKGTPRAAVKPCLMLREEGGE